MRGWVASECAAIPEPSLAWAAWMIAAADCEVDSTTDQPEVSGAVYASSYRCPCFVAPASVFKGFAKLGLLRPTNDHRKQQECNSVNCHRYCQMLTLCKRLPRQENTRKAKKKARNYGRKTRVIVHSTRNPCCGAADGGGEGPSACSP